MNEPDSSSDPLGAIAESFVASSFRTWWPVAGHDDYPAWAFSTMANEITSGFADFGQLELSAEPRSGWNSTTPEAGEHTVEFEYEPWSWRVGWIVSLVCAVGLIGLAWRR